MRKTSLFISVSLSLTLVLLYSPPPRIVPEGKDKYVYLSIDDCISCYQDLTDNGSYRSVFQQPFFRFLKDIHDTYDAKFTLYSFKENKDIDVSMIPERFKKELADNHEWITISFHARSYGESLSDVTTDDFVKAYDSFYDAFYPVTGGYYKIGKILWQ